MCYIVKKNVKTDQLTTLEELSFVGMNDLMKKTILHQVVKKVQYQCL